MAIKNSLIGLVVGILTTNFVPSSVVTLHNVYPMLTKLTKMVPEKKKKIIFPLSGLGLKIGILNSFLLILPFPDTVPR